MSKAREIDCEFWVKDVVALRVEAEKYGDQVPVGMVTEIKITQKEELFLVSWEDRTNTFHYDYELVHGSLERVEDDE